MRNSMNLLDSSVIISLFRKEETNHRKACEIFANLQGFIISDYVLSEVATVLRLREGLRIATKAVTLLKWNTDVEIIRLTDGELEMTTHLFLREKTQLSFVDASLLILAKKRKLRLVSFDIDLQKISSLDK